MISELVSYLRELEPEFYPLRDMTPAQIARRYGPTVSDYVVELRWEAETWRKIANERAESTVTTEPRT
jgi:hypothetical protein